MFYCIAVMLNNINDFTLRPQWGKKPQFMLLNKSHALALSANVAPCYSVYTPGKSSQ